MTDHDEFKGARYFVEILISAADETHFSPSIAIREGSSADGRLLHAQDFKELICADENSAKKAAGELAHGWLAGWRILGAQRSTGDGATYSYAGRIGYARDTAWEAKIYRDGEYRGQISGLLVGKSLTSATDEALARQLIEETVATGVGFVV